MNCPHIVLDQAGIYKTPVLYEGSPVTKKRKVEQYEIELYTTNSGSTILDGVKHPIKKGMILFSKPGEIRNSVLPFYCKFIHIEPPDAQYKEFMSFLSEIPSILRGLNNEKYDMLFDSIINTKFSPTENSEVLLQSKILELLYSLYSDSHSSYDKKEELQKVISYMTDHISEHITLETLGDILHFSPNYMHKYFKKQTGITPYKYLLDMRINKAKQMLEFSNSSFSFIAEKCGFESQAYFCYSFKKETKMTPGKYRKIKGSANYTL